MSSLSRILLVASLLAVPWHVAAQPPHSLTAQATTLPSLDCAKLASSAGHDYVSATLEVNRYVSPARLQDSESPTCMNHCRVFYTILGTLRTDNIRARLLPLTLTTTTAARPPILGDTFAFCFARDPSIEGDFPRHEGTTLVMNRQAKPLQLSADALLLVSPGEATDHFITTPAPFLTATNPTAQRECSNLSSRYGHLYHYGEGTLGKVVEKIPPTHSYQGIDDAFRPQSFIVTLKDIGAQTTTVMTINGVAREFTAPNSAPTTNMKYGFCYTLHTHHNGSPQVITVDRPETLTHIKEDTHGTIN